MTEQDAVQTVILMDVFKGESAQSQDTVSTRKRAGPDSSDAAMKRQRKEQTSAQDVSRCGNPVHSTWQQLKPLLPTLPGGLIQASYLASPCMETHVGKASVGERPNESKKTERQTASTYAHQRRRSECKEGKGSSICEHQRRRSRCKECKGSGICQHKRQRTECVECGGSSICQHKRRRNECMECGGSSICHHRRIRSRCKDCRAEAPTEAGAAGMEALDEA